MKKLMAIIAAAAMLVMCCASFSALAVSTPWDDDSVKINVYDTLDSKQGAVGASDLTSIIGDNGGSTAEEQIALGLERISMEFKDGELCVNKLLQGWYEIIFNFGASYGELNKTDVLGFYLRNDTEQTLDLQPRWVGDSLKAALPGNSQYFLADLDGKVTEYTSGVYGSCLIPGGFEGFFLVDINKLRNDDSSGKAIADCTISKLATRIGGMNLDQGNGTIVFDNFFGMGKNVTDKNSALVLEAESKSTIDPIEIPEPGTSKTPWEDENVKISVLESFDFPDREIDITEMQVPDIEMPYNAKYQDGKVVIYNTEVESCSYFRFEMQNRDNSAFRHADGIGFYIKNDTPENVMLGLKMLGTNLYVIDNDMPVKLFNMEGNQVVATVSNDCLYVPARFEGYVTIAVEYLLGYWNEGSFKPEWERGVSNISSIGFQTYYLWVEPSDGDTVTFDDFFVYGKNVKDNKGDVVVAKVGGELIDMPLNEGDAAPSPTSQPTSKPTVKPTGAATQSAGTEPGQTENSNSWIIWAVVGAVVVIAVIVVIVLAAKKKKNGGDSEPKAE